jgi:MoxR-like ATPase
MTTTNDTTITTSAQAARDFIDKFSSSFIERDRESKALLLATVAELPVVLLGPPGTGKSMMINTFSKACQGEYFQYLVTRFTTPDELFGQFKISALKKDKLERAWKGTMVDSKFIFLDEVFKASSALLNSLLTALNEKQADVGTGRQDMQYELIAGASNELPEEGVGLDALWDRWAIRLWVEGIASDQGFERLASDTNLGQVTETLDMEHIKVLREARDSVDISGIMPTLIAARGKLMEQGIVLSDRKWVSIFRAIKAKAVLQGRMGATKKDIAVLTCMAWNNQGQIPTVSQICNELSAGKSALIRRLRDDIGDIEYGYGGTDDMDGVVTQALDYISTAYEIGKNEGWDKDCQHEFTEMLRSWVMNMGDIVNELNRAMKGYDISQIAAIAKNMGEVNIITQHVKDLQSGHCATFMASERVTSVVDGLRTAVMTNNDLFRKNTNNL